MKIKLLNPAHRKRAKRYRKPYDDSANIKQTDMKRTFFDDIAERLTARPTSQSNEVLFFASAHFLFFNFKPAHKTHFHFFTDLQPNAEKNERVFSPTLYKYISI